MSNTPETIKIAIAGSTERTVRCADALLKDPRFSISWILTSSPRLVGRKQTLTSNPLHNWSREHAIESVLVDLKITSQTTSEISKLEKIDILLVVDFGYLVPKWLLELPKYAPLNIHPSFLPRWRGSSPGQFVLLYGDKTSAVTLMIMDEALDEGPIIAQLPFTVSDGWTQTEYYQKSFDLMTEQLPDLIQNFVTQKIPPTPQPLDSPTPIARRLTREDGFIEWAALKAVMDNKQISTKSVTLGPLLSAAAATHVDLLSLITHACNALSPWPGLWTIVPTSKGDKRLKILKCHQEMKPTAKLQLDFVQLEGKQPTPWNEIRNIVS